MNNNRLNYPLKTRLEPLMRILLAIFIFTFLGAAGTANAQIGAPKPDIYGRLEPLDISHSNNQRTDIARRFLDMGYNIKGDERDLEIIQRMLSLGKVRREDIATQQALGVVFGDILAKRLDLDWVIVDDKHGRSRALRYKKTDIVVFPVTMISRRYKTGLDPDVQALYDKTVQSLSRQIAQQTRY